MLAAGAEPECGAGGMLALLAAATAQMGRCAVGVDCNSPVLLPGLVLQNECCIKQSRHTSPSGRRVARTLQALLGLSSQMQDRMGAERTHRHRARGGSGPWPPGDGGGGPPRLSGEWQLAVAIQHQTEFN